MRTAFPWAANVTSVVRDQSACGSCWAFGSTEAFNDRMAILNNYTQLLSAADTAFCCTGMSDGCNGGFTDEAWSYFTSKGIVTGAGFDSIGSGSSCLPYPFEVSVCGCWLHGRTSPRHHSLPTSRHPPHASADLLAPRAQPGAPQLPDERVPDQVLPQGLLREDVPCRLGQGHAPRQDVLPPQLCRGGDD